MQRPLQAAAPETSASHGHADGLSLEDIYSKLRLQVSNLEAGATTLDSKDPKYGVEIIKIQNFKRSPSLGMELVEVARKNDGRGLVLVGGLAPGGNAEATGKIRMGDTLSWVGVEPGSMTKVEALNWDKTVEALGKYADQQEITVVLKRLVKRQPVEVVFSLPEGKESTVTMLSGSNLRSEMMRLEVPVYDTRTRRYDQPYATGNCGGEGLCGTCFVEVQSGGDLLTKADQQEEMVMRKLPVRWRLSCRAVVGKDNKEGSMRLRAVPQADWVEEKKRET